MGIERTVQVINGSMGTQAAPISLRVLFSCGRKSTPWLSRQQDTDSLSEVPERVRNNRAIKTIATAPKPHFNSDITDLQTNQPTVQRLGVWSQDSNRSKIARNELYKIKYNHTLVFDHIPLERLVSLFLYTRWLKDR